MEPACGQLGSLAGLGLGGDCRRGQRQAWPDGGLHRDRGLRPDQRAMYWPPGPRRERGPCGRLVFRGASVFVPAIRAA